MLIKIKNTISKNGKTIFREGDEVTAERSLNEHQLGYIAEGIWIGDDDAEISNLAHSPAPARSEHTPREIADFLIDEVLDPFVESSLYEDYTEDYEQRDKFNRHREGDFSARYDEGVALLRAAPDLLEALEELLASTQKSYIPKHNAVSKARAALNKAKGEHQ